MNFYEYLWRFVLQESHGLHCIYLFLDACADMSRSVALQEHANYASASHWLTQYIGMVVQNLIHKAHIFILELQISQEL